MSLLVLDTCAWLWISQDHERIEPYKNQLASSDWLLSAISVWEVAMLAQKGKIAFDMPVKTWVHRALTPPGLAIAPLDPDIAILSCEMMDFPHKDPADRMILATAIHHEATLVTADRVLLQYAKSKRYSVLAID